MAEDGTAVLQIYDTFTGSKRPLTLLEPGKCGVYTCGPTVYDMSHIGHGRAALASDVLVRFLRHQGLEVTYVRNVTDIDDKIIARANERGEDPGELAQRYLDEYLHDLDAMGLVRPTVMPRVTQTVPEIIELVQSLIDQDLAYEVEGDVYFVVSGFEDYCKLSGRNLEDMRAGARVDVDERKRDPADFALWKAAKPGEPAWDSPWGKGRPGWHIECSAMSCKHLGKTFDIHTGGRDLIFPHHENEIAQSQGAHGKGTYAQHWIHNGFVNFAGEKMSKSLGNFFTMREVTELYHPEVVRYFLLGVQYRSGINFDVQVHCPTCDVPMGQDEQEAGKCAAGHESSAAQLKTQVRFPGLEEADERVAYVYTTLQQAQAYLAQVNYEDDGGDVPEPVGSMREGFVEAMRDDLNTAAAFAVLSEPLSLANRLIASGKGVAKDERKRTLARFVAHMKDLAQIAGCFERDPSEYLAARRDLKAKRIGLDVAKVEELVKARLDARAAKDWGRADEVRDELAALGVKLRDGGGVTHWSL